MLINLFNTVRSSGVPCTLRELLDLLGALEKNDLFLKKIGKTVRKIFVNFESKLPIDKIIFFYGISNFKERLLLYLP